MKRPGRGDATRLKARPNHNHGALRKSVVVIEQGRCGIVLDGDGLLLPVARNLLALPPILKAENAPNENVRSEWGEALGLKLMLRGLQRGLPGQGVGGEGHACAELGLM
jgi:hypothetical protein